MRLSLHATPFPPSFMASFSRLSPSLFLSVFLSLSLILSLYPSLYLSFSFSLSGSQTWLLYTDLLKDKLDETKRVEDECRIWGRNYEER